MKDGVTFPNIKVFREKKNATPYLVDGFHHTAATVLIGGDTIEADIIYGDRAAALTFTLKANADHGLRRNNADKRHALEMAWANRQCLFEGSGMRDEGTGKDDFIPSSRQLAAICGVSKSAAHIFIKEMGVSKMDRADATTATEDHLEERNANVLRNPKEGKDRFDIVIPERILPAFLSTQPKVMLRDIRRLRKQLETALGNAEIAFAGDRTADADRPRVMTNRNVSCVRVRVYIYPRVTVTVQYLVLVATVTCSVTRTCARIAG